MKVIYKKGMLILTMLILLLNSGNTLSNTSEIHYLKSEVKILKLTVYIINKYKVKTSLAEDIVRHAHTLGDSKGFPSPTDILAIIAIESSFNKNIVSKANAKGLMQVLYKKTLFDVYTNMGDGVFLLKDYRSKLSKDATIQAYNLGIGSYYRGKRNYKYLDKFKTTKAHLDRVINHNG